jgi:hypothetical protein
MDRLDSAKKWATLVSGVVFLLLVVAFGIWLNKPYPKVSVIEAPQDLPLLAPQEVGTEVSWSLPKVCIPVGKTTAEIKATFIFPTGEDGTVLGSVSTTLQSRSYVLTEPYCGEPDRTRIIIPSNLPNGKYQITVTACTENPTPFPECVGPVKGPLFTVKGQPF